MTGLPKGYDERKALPIYDFLVGYFPLAIIELVKVAVVGNEQHNPGERLHWARGKSMDQLNTAMRHIFDHGMGNVYDDDGRTMHLAKAAWRLLAEVQLRCEARAREAEAPSKPAPASHEVQAVRPAVVADLRPASLVPAPGFMFDGPACGPDDFGGTDEGSHYCATRQGLGQ